MNSFFGIGIFELFFIAIIALIVLGPERMPGAIREVAKYFRMLRNLSSEFTSQFSEELQALDEINSQKLLRELTEDPVESETAKPAKSTRKPAAKKPSAAVTAKKAVASDSAKTAEKPVATEDEPETKAEDGAQGDTGAAADQPVEVTGTANSPQAPEEETAAGDEVDVENSILPPHLQEAAATSNTAGEQNVENGSSPVQPLDQTDAAPSSVTSNGTKGKAEDEA